MNVMFLISFVVILICVAFGIIAVVWALQIGIGGGDKATSCPFTPVVVQLSKITSQSKQRHPSFIRERLLRLMMIFERSVVNGFSFQVHSILSSPTRWNSSVLNTHVSLITAQGYFCGRQSVMSCFFNMSKAVLFSTMRYFLHGRTELQLVPEPVRVRPQQRQ